MSIRLRGACAAVLVSVFAIGAVAASVGAATPITFHVQLASSCIDGTAPANARIVITLKTDTGVVRARTAETVNRDGSWFTCLFTMATLTGIHGGDVLSATAAGMTHRWRIPHVTARVDRVRDRITGTAPANTSLHVLIQPDFIENLVTVSPGMDVTADRHGAFALDVSKQFDLTGGDAAMASAQFGNDSLMLITYAPFVWVTRGSDLVMGATDPGSTVQLDLRSGGTTRARASGTTLTSNVFELTLQTLDGQPAYPRRGDHLRANVAGGIDLKIPAMGLAGNPRTNVVSGRCMPNAHFSLRVEREPDFSNPNVTFVDEMFRGTTHADGVFHKTVSPRVDLKAGDQLTLTCRWPSGDLLEMETTAKRINP